MYVCILRRRIMYDETKFKKIDHNARPRTEDRIDGQQTRDVNGKSNDKWLSVGRILFACGSGHNVWMRTF